MVKTNLAAWTPAEDRPPYVSMNYVSSVEGAVEITIRGQKKDNGDYGDVVCVRVPLDGFQDVLNQLRKNINKGNENVLLNAVKASYLKHHLDTDKIGWSELSDILLNALCVTMGDKGYQDWIASVES